jgi:thiamine biosynthesis lipoprotein
MYTNALNLEFNPAPLPKAKRSFSVNGSTMGTRYAVQFFARAGANISSIKTKLQNAVDMVDQQMSPWIAGSDVNRINAAKLDQWIEVPAACFDVIATGLEIGRNSEGAFDIGLGHLTNHFGFGPSNSNAMDGQCVDGSSSTFTAIQLDPDRKLIRKSTPIQLDLCGIAKGYGVDELARVLRDEDISDFLVSIDGELRASGSRPGGKPWTIALESPDINCRQGLKNIQIGDIALATSGDYRHRRIHDGEKISHTMDGQMNRPARNNLTSVTVAAQTCMEADAWATALMVKGPDAGQRLANAHGIPAIFLEKSTSGLQVTGTAEFASI